jgi:nicotinamidase-related amidase
MEIQSFDTAVVFIDPQNDVLSEKGANWGAVGASVTENNTVENMEKIFKAAKANQYEVFIRRIIFIQPTAAGSSTARLRPTNSKPTHSRAEDRWISPGS